MEKFFLMSCVFLIFSTSAMALQIGDMAPDFTQKVTGQGEVTLSKLKGKWVALYFYPKSFTPGCTAESCSLRDGFRDLQEMGVIVLGASLDKLETQNDFKKEYNLPFELISDHDKKVAKLYGVLGLLGLYTERKTFLINPEGKIAHIFESVKTKDHGSQILDKIKELTQK